MGRVERSRMKDGQKGVYLMVVEVSMSLVCASLMRFKDKGSWECKSTRQFKTVGLKVLGYRVRRIKIEVMMVGPGLGW